MAKNVLPRRGQKLNTDEGDLEELLKSAAELLESKRTVFKQSLEQRTKRRQKDISVGEYIKSVNMVYLIQPRGKMMQAMGKSYSRDIIPKNEPMYCDVLCVDGATKPTYPEHLITSQLQNTIRMIHPEEALYMLDIGAMALYYTNDAPEIIDVVIKGGQSIPDGTAICRRGNLIKSTQEAFGLFAHHFPQPQLFVNTFKLYTYMRKAGYIVHRHDKALYEDEAPKADTFSNFMRSVLSGKSKPKGKSGGGKNVGKEKKKGNDKIVKQKKMPRPTNGSGPMRGWYPDENDLAMQQNQLSPSDICWGHEPFFTQDDTKPLIHDLNLKHGDQISTRKLFEQLDIIQQVKPTESENADFIIFDVWQGYEKPKNTPPSLAVSLQEQEGTTSLSWASPGVMNYWNSLNTTIPLHRAVIGESGTITFMSLKPLHLDNLM